MPGAFCRQAPFAGRTGLAPRGVLGQLAVDARCPEGSFIEKRGVALHQGGAGIQPFLDILGGLDAADGHQSGEPP